MAALGCSWLPSASSSHLTLLSSCSTPGAGATASPLLLQPPEPPWLSDSACWLAECLLASRQRLLAAQWEAHEEPGALPIPSTSTLGAGHPAVLWVCPAVLWVGAGHPAVLRVSPAQLWVGAGHPAGLRTCCPVSSCALGGPRADPAPVSTAMPHSPAQQSCTGTQMSAGTPLSPVAAQGPVGAVMAFWWKADASLSLTAYDKYGACCQGKIYPFLSFYQLSNMFDFSQALSVVGI